MKAFLLGGGFGTRLRPVTDHAPKCMVDIGGSPLLGIWLDLCARHGIREALVTVRTQADVVRRYVEGRADLAGRLTVTVVEEPEPIGSAGTLARHRRFVADEASFFICYLDNLTAVDLEPMRRCHASHDAVLTLGLFRAPRPEQAGVVQLDEAGRVVNYDEKPVHPASDLANAGVYLARQVLFDELPARDGVIDLGADVLPGLVGRMFGYEIPEFLIDIGTPDGLAAGRHWWAGAAAR